MVMFVSARPVNTKGKNYNNSFIFFIPLFYRVTNSFLQTSQGTNITLVDGNLRSSHVGALGVGTGTIVVPSETTVDDYNDSKDYDADDSYMFGDGTESDDEETSDNSLLKAISVLSSELQSCRNLTTHSLRDRDANNDANANGNALVVAGCRMCMLYIMLPAGTNVCFRCGNSGLIHFGGNGQA
jgi:hypothetical protein